MNIEEKNEESEHLNEQDRQLLMTEVTSQKQIAESSRIMELSLSVADEQKPTN